MSADTEITINTETTFKKTQGVVAFTAGMRIEDDEIFITAPSLGALERAFNTVRVNIGGTQKLIVERVQEVSIYGRRLSE